MKLHMRLFPSLKLFTLFLLLYSITSFAEIRYISKTGSSIPSYKETVAEFDTTKQVQYRRGIELQEGYQSYDEKYAGKNLNEEKRSLFPASSDTVVWIELNPKVPRVDYLGIHFINKDTGFAVGAYGALIKTTDGGISWETKESNTANPLLKIRNFNDDIIIASGFDGIIIRSTDGGDNWQNVITSVTGDLWGLFAVNDSIGWVCGNYNSLMKTTDAGLSWQVIQTPGYTADYWWIDFLNVDYGFIAANGKVLKTTDGGNTWEIIQAGDDYSLFSIDLIDSLHIAAAGYGGTSYRGKNIYSSDAGYTWTNGGQLTFEAVNCIQYVDPDTGYLVMTNVSARKTTNRGETWITLQGISDHYELQFLDILNDRIGISAGTGLKLSRAEGNLNIWNRLIINDNFADVFFVNEEKGFAISGILSPIQALYKTTNGGINWAQVPGAPSGNDLLFLDSLTGFIGTDNIYKTTDGGESWYVPSGGSGGAGKFFFIDEMTGWAIRSNKIYKTTDRGENWITQFTVSTSIGFKGIYFIDSLLGWTANYGGRPFKTTNGGDNWIQQTNLDIWQSIDVFFVDYLNGFLLESNKLYKTTNGGINFNLVPDIPGFSVAGKLSHYPDSTIFITGYKTYRSIDVGFNWLDFIELTGIRINGLSLLGIGSGFAVGELGLVLRYYDETVPVELLSFTAEINQNNVTLNWETATETNNRGFEVERKTNNDWITIAFIEGKGTTTDKQVYSFTDKNLETGRYTYRLKQIDFDGTFEYSDEVEVDVSVPKEFALNQNYPNPFNPSTTISFSLPRSEYVKIKIYNTLGEEIKTLVNSQLDAGVHKISFDASNVSSGIYFYKITAGEYTGVKKMQVMK